MASEKRRKRRRAARLRAFGRLIKYITVAVLIMAFVAIGVYFVLDKKPELTVMTYPVKYEDLIRSYAAQNDIPPAYVASVIMAESSYRPEAVSSVNAQGLMQILPETAQWIAGKLDETYTENCLFDPETNIRYGCWYLGFLMNRYNHNMKCSSAGYHAGQGTVDGWLKNPQYSQDGATLDVIPSDVTRAYVNNVLKYYEKYEEIYA